MLQQNRLSLVDGLLDVVRRAADAAEARKNLLSQFELCHTERTSDQPRVLENLINRKVKPDYVPKGQLGLKKF